MVIVSSFILLDFSSVSLIIFSFIQFFLSLKTVESGFCCQCSSVYSVYHSFHSSLSH